MRGFVCFVGAALALSLVIVGPGVAEEPEFTM